MPLKAEKAEWLSDLTDSTILKLRFKDLALSISGTDVEAQVNQLYSELEKKGLTFRPKIFLGDEWFSPEGMNAIAVPFYLASTRLKQLEKTLMLEVEGGDPDWFMKLLRHEAGHCFDHCYKFSKRKKWSEVFGSPSIEYNPETYRPQPYSKSYVKHLDRWYAQAHPDEDFAETFAVWLNPNSDWKKEYSKWPGALIKLEYVDHIASESSKLKNTAEKGRLPCDVSSLTSTLEKYYLKRKRENADDYPDFYDSDLKTIFNGDMELSKREFSAGRFMNKHRKAVVSTVAWATSERKFTIDALVKRLAERSDKLELRLGKSETQTTMEVASFLTSLVKNYLFTGKFKREV
ncbi:MAG: putative zinc-binding metallopeptidase [Pseudobdellovibrio sp.]